MANTDAVVRSCELASFGGITEAINRLSGGINNTNVHTK